MKRLSFEELPEINSERWNSLERLEGETWKEIFPEANCKYFVSDYGRVKGFTRFGEKIIYTSNILGYKHVSISYNGKKKMCRIHRLVAEVFIQNPNDLPIINHKDENKANNTVENIEWCDYSYNNNYGTRNERCSVSNTASKSIPIAQYSLDGTYIRTYKSFKEAKKILGINLYMPRNGYDSKYSQSGGYMWRYCEKGVDMTKDIPPYIQSTGKPKSISQYTKDGVFIASYHSAIIASKETGVSYNSMRSCAQGKCHTAGGYVWKYGSYVGHKFDMTEKTTNKMRYNELLKAKKNKEEDPC